MASLQSPLVDLDIPHYLSGVDPILGTIIRRVGPCGWRPKPGRTPFESLVRAVAHQQLHGKAAESILRRFQALVPSKKFPGAADIASLGDEALRGAGFSAAKIASIRDIAAKAMDGIVPGPRKIAQLEDEEIVARLTSIRGVGRWTVEMLLIFQLGRPDVLPVDDFGVRNGFRIAYSLPELPKPKELLSYGERWRPYRTTAAWYLWRATEQPKNG